MKQVSHITYRGVEIDSEKVSNSPVLAKENFAMFYKAGMARRTFMQEGQVYRMHESSILLVTEGWYETSLDLEDYHLEKGDVLVTGTNTMQEMQRASDDFNMVAFSISEDIAVDEILVLHTETHQWRELMQLTDMLWAIAHQIPFRKNTISAMVKTILTDIQETSSENQPATSEKPTKGDMLLSRFKKLVSQHCEEQRNVGFYADQLYLTPNHLSAVINRQSGKTVMQWINHAVILKAKVLLKTSDMKTYEIADKLHFPDHATFTKFFKRETGMTPKEYIKE